MMPIKQEKSHHIRTTKEALAGYDSKEVYFDLSTLSAQFALAIEGGLDIKDMRIFDAPARGGRLWSGKGDSEHYGWR